MERRVVITGIGICAPVDFAGLVAGDCGLVTPAEWSVPEAALCVGQVRLDMASAVRALPGAWKPDRLDPVSHFALVAAHAAREDAGLTDSRMLASAAVVVASAMGGERTHHGASKLLTEHQTHGGKLRLSAFTAPKLMPNAASANVGMLLGAHGPNFSPSAACASGAYAISQAADQIRLGRASVAITGAAEAPCEEIAARTFLAGEALSATGQSRPFHRERNGFVLAEGAAVLVLEELEHARRRGARIYAEYGGAGLTCDAYHVVAPQPEGEFAADAMCRALAEAQVPADAVGYVNAHGTATLLGDVAECRALRRVFGGRLPLVSSTKGATGHLLGAAGALEAAFTILAIYTGQIPPTLHLDAGSTDPECAAGGFDFVCGTAREASLRAALSNSFAFGGHNASLLFTRFEG